MHILKVCDDFCKELKKRTGLLTEDNIRYYWFASMLKQDADLNHYSLEEPYGPTTGPHKELDLMYEDGKEILIFEIKFHKNIGSTSLAKTEAAGRIFSDLQRLPKWLPSSKSKKTIQRFFLYVTDNDMHNYLGRPSGRFSSSAYRSELKKFYPLVASKPTIGSLDFIKGRDPITFTNCIDMISHPTIPSINIIFAEDNVIPKCGDYYMRVYEL